MRRIRDSSRHSLRGSRSAWRPPGCAAENLAQAWAIALGVNQRLQSQQLQSVAAGLDVEAAARRGCQPCGLSRSTPASPAR